MKLVLQICLSVLIFSAHFSCTKDSQKFEVKEVNEASISSDTTNYIREQFVPLKIQPIITESLVSDTYNYEWKVLGGANKIAKVVSNARDLDIIVDLPPDSYKIQYTLTNVSTGLKAFYQYNLDVVGAFHKGWLVSHNLKGLASLGFIRSDGVVFVDPASETNERIYPGTALAAYHQGKPYNFIVFFTTEGAFRFNHSDFYGIGDTKQLFGNDKKFSKPLYRLGVSDLDQFVIDPTGLYAGLGHAFFTGADLLAPFSERIAGDYEIFPYLIDAGTTNYFYDNKYKRFIQIAYLERRLDITSGSPPGAVFDRANIGKTAIAAGRGQSSSRHHFILTSEDGRYVYTLNGITPLSKQKVDDSSSPDFSQATTFLPSRLYNHIYYALDNKLYLYNINANTAQLIYTFPNGSRVKDMQWSPSLPVRGIAVALDNGSNGEVYFFEVNEFGKFSGDTYHTKHTGFGNIGHLSYKAS